ncbi:Vacuolar protein sorting-associated protein 9A [Quillaja saponaria]|uniref:Vacuolar protein sorting-associated protein 9A n=1 Tax=Quillaja saponaria TaxID=32244 RepID=A0AAD7LWH2_QUISA|nr:Vacuolar protein sorting-associated protein 9A [Quillaja saponaria]KAJ7965638.1 Vacuolar protein sorting-associated protein 9A [Quillaja saponaria]
MENADVFLGLHDFLERMRQPSAADFVKAIKSFIVSFSHNAPDPERDSAAVQQFLTNMEAAFRAHPLWAGCTEEELESAAEGLEKYVMTKLFSRVFAPQPDDVELDDQLSEKMALIQQFIQPENLDIKPTFQNETCWLLAQKELQKINMYKAPRDKLVCILNCCKVISNLLHNASIASNENLSGADEFLPVLIYVTIKANPPQLCSNLFYIQRFRRQSRLVSETAYFFTNMLSAESFISSIDAKAISMDEAEFEKNMETARALLSGLSTDSHDQSNLNDQISGYLSKAEPMEHKNQALNDNKECAIEPKLSGAKSGSKEVISANQLSITNVPSLSDLENRGATMLFKEDQVNQVFWQYPYLFAQVGDLTFSDVEDLLNNYKQLVFKYVCLSKGMGIAAVPLPASNSQNVQPKNGESTVESESSKPIEPTDTQLDKSLKSSSSTDNSSDRESLLEVESFESKLPQDEAVAPQGGDNIETE